VILCLAVFVELRYVTDTDRHRSMASTADAKHRAVKTSRYKIKHRQDTICVPDSAADSNSIGSLTVLLESPSSVTYTQHEMSVFVSASLS